MKKQIPIELKKKLKKFDQIHQGVLSHFTSKFSVLYGGRGRIVDTSPFVQYTVRYTAVFAKPKVGAKLVGKIVNIIRHAETGNIIIMSEVEGDLVCITKCSDPSRLEVIEGDSVKASDSEDAAEVSDDSVFEEHTSTKEIQLKDNKKGRTLKQGTRIKLQIEDIQVSEGTLILQASLL